ncbi:cell wall-associated NlpC family hydrolase [Prosthecobacter fusiformis]|uniref:Cell wall-associated NlpC family hydrolase n=1 Tax=Prosthecobacter fusiformis TaxID=48464 RepID=A0A4R7RM50_9BACT|nr:NlpC/P60 family protein [Prosthecobacter fusiformis]TDU64662.1 cell wall-associated NlpC family hydrolase [Prosthecobacter fusiformis]
MKRILPIALLTFALIGHGETPEKKTTVSESEQIKEGPATDGPPVAAVSSIEVDDIQGFEYYAPQIQELIRQSLALTKLNLTYSFGSADPKNGGMDCSGTIYYVLHDFGFKGVPRQSNEMAGWVQDKTLLHRVHEADALTHPEFSALQPGNLLFWSGTYDAGPRKIPVTHVMLYLGKLKKSGKHIVFGASDGRSYQGKRRSGVSVFDFSLPRSTSSASFYGYGMIPGVGKIEAKPEPVAPKVIAEAKTVVSESIKTITEAKPTPSMVKVSEPVKPTPTPVKEETSTKPVRGPIVVVAPPQTEEVRSAIRVEDKPASVPEKPKVASPAKPQPTQVASASKTSNTKPKTTSTTKSSSTKSKPVVRKKAPPPPPTPLARAKQAASSFFNDVRRSLPQGVGR